MKFAKFIMVAVPSIALQTKLKKNKTKNTYTMTKLTKATILSHYSMIVLFQIPRSFFEAFCTLNATLRCMMGSWKGVSRAEEQSTFFMYFYLILSRCWWFIVGMNSGWTQDSKYQTTLCPQARFGLQHNCFRPSKGLHRLKQCFDLL